MEKETYREIKCGNCGSSRFCLYHVEGCWETPTKIAAFCMNCDCRTIITFSKPTLQLIGDEKGSAVVWNRS